MPYPEIFLTKPLRRAFMVFLIVLFFVSAPLILAYTAGYRYDWSSHEIKQTGVISIDIKPVDATVTIGGVVIQDGMPLRLPNRAPGTYHLSINKIGYMPWEKDITVESKKTLYIRDVTLFRDMVPALLDTLPTNPVSLTASYDGAYLLYMVHKDQLYELGLYDTANTRQTAVLNGNWDERPEIFWSPRHDRAVFVFTKNDKTTRISLFDPALHEIIAEKTLHVSGTAPLFVWSADANTPYIWLRDNNTLVLLGEPTTRDAILLPDNNTPWYFDGKHLWLYSAAHQSIDLIADTRISYPVSEPILFIVDANSQRIIAQSQTRTFILHTQDQLPTPDSLQATNTRLNPYTGEWNIWSDNELWTVYLDGHATLLNRTGEKIYDVHPLDQFGVLLLATPGRILGFNPGYYVTHELFSHGSFSSLAVNQKNRTIYFVGEIGKQTGVFTLQY